VLRGKGGRSRTVGVDATGAELLAAWLTARRRLGFDGRGPVFCSAGGRALTSAQVRRRFRALGVRAQIAKRVHPHGLRHTHAAELREEGIDIGIISKQLGHRSIATTATYLDHIAPLAVVEAMRARERDTSATENRKECLEAGAAAG
jgi:site-specific recombinase XerD